MPLGPRIRRTMPCRQRTDSEHPRPPGSRAGGRTQSPPAAVARPVAGSRSAGTLHRAARTIPALHERSFLVVLCPSRLPTGVGTLLPIAEYGPADLLLHLLAALRGPCCD